MTPPTKAERDALRAVMAKSNDGGYCSRSTAEAKAYAACLPLLDALDAAEETEGRRWNEKLIGAVKDGTSNYDTMPARLQAAEAERDRLREALTLAMARVSHKRRTYESVLGYEVTDDESCYTGCEACVVEAALRGPARLCEMVHVNPGIDGMGHERPCTNEAKWLHEHTVPTCDECAAAMRKEGFELSALRDPTGGGDGGGK